MTSPWTDDNVLFERAQLLRCRLEELAARQTQASGYFSRRKRVQAQVQIMAEVEDVERQLASIDMEARVKDEFEDYCRGNSILRMLVKDRDDEIDQLRRPLERERMPDELPDPNTHPHETLHIPIPETMGMNAVERFTSRLDPLGAKPVVSEMRMRTYRKTQMRQGNATWFEWELVGERGVGEFVTHDAVRQRTWVNGRPVEDFDMAYSIRRR